MLRRNSWTRGLVLRQGNRLSQQSTRHMEMTLNYTPLFIRTFNILSPELGWRRCAASRNDAARNTLSRTSAYSARSPGTRPSRLRTSISSTRRTGRTCSDRPGCPGAGQTAGLRRGRGPIPGHNESAPESPNRERSALCLTEASSPSSWIRCWRRLLALGNDQPPETADCDIGDLTCYYLKTHVMA